MTISPAKAIYVGSTLGVLLMLLWLLLLLRRWSQWKEVRERKRVAEEQTHPSSRWRLSLRCGSCLL